jgi:hypothetical protein
MVQQDHPIRMHPQDFIRVKRILSGDELCRLRFALTPGLGGVDGICLPIA